MVAQMAVRIIKKHTASAIKKGAILNKIKLFGHPHLIEEEVICNKKKEIKGTAKKWLSRTNEILKMR